MNEEAKKKLASESGLVYSGKNTEGELEFIGTEKKWQSYENALMAEDMLGRGSPNCPYCEGTGIAYYPDGKDDYHKEECVCVKYEKGTQFYQ